MKRLLGVLAVAVLASAIPSDADAQCSAACLRLFKENGEIAGYGCVWSENSGTSCIASATRCIASRCANAFLTTPEGRVIGEIPCANAAADATRLAEVAEALRERLLAVIAYPIRIAHARPPLSPTAD